MKRTLLLLCCSVVCWLLSCSPKYAKFANENSYAHKGEGEPDYSDLYYWAAHPYKKDPSDSIPLPLRRNYLKDTTVDVFFIHPTTFTSKEDTGWNADVNEAAINAKTDYSSILYQASAFNEYRVFAPRCSSGMP